MSNYHDDDGTFSGGFFMALLLIGGICLGYWVRDSGVTLHIQNGRVPRSEAVRPAVTKQQGVK
ncbi:MAG: hypothetical protein LH660_04950 [Phormidesmis sp. CAN_BIN36]|nr:hypothetical protein [Phormidesmis sp. CAN_BIN36]